MKRVEPPRRKPGAPIAGKGPTQSARPTAPGVTFSECIRRPGAPWTMRIPALLIATLAFPLPAPPALAAQEAAVHAIFFYSPTCPHCHDVMDRDLPPLREKYGERLRIIGVDVSSRGGQDLYQATVEHFRIPQNRLGVPTMVVGTEILVGSLEIPQRFPGIIERGLASGGIDWPPVDAVRQALTAQGVIRPRPTPLLPPAASPEPTRQTDSAAGAPARQTGAAERATPPADNPGGSVAEDAPDSAAGEAGGVGGPPATPDAGFDLHLAPDSAIAFTPPTRTDLFLRDPLGNGIAVATLLLLLAALGWSARVMLRHGGWTPSFPGWLFPALAAVGMVVAAYMSFVEVTGAEAVCGPVGDCNAVQQSPYAILFGVLPVGVLGLIGYLALLMAWGAARWGPASLAPGAWTAAWAMAWIGTAFSAYLTFLEPFVIGATCAWCISSALIMVLMLAEATARAATAPPA